MNKIYRVKCMSVFFFVIVSICLLSGCAKPQPQASPEQIQAIMGALGTRSQQPQVRPAIDFSTHPKISVNAINNDSFGLKESIYDRFEEMGVQVVSDPNDADVMLSGTVEYVGDPDDRPSQFNDMRKKAQVAGVATGAASLGMGMASPFGLVSSGARLLASTAAEAMEPNRIQGIVVMHIRQGDKMWDVDLDHTVEAPKGEAEQKLATEISHSILSKLGG